tara:strand:- start:16851 stop:17084 length:234 start_codon:yes stop_codon:yes gene_type:complete
MVSSYIPIYDKICDPVVVIAKISWILSSLKDTVSPGLIANPLVVETPRLPTKMSTLFAEYALSVIPILQGADAPGCI